MNIAQVRKIETECKARIRGVCPTVSERSGIYFLLREEDGFRYAYIGQAKHLLTRLAAHLRGFQHIDLSIKKHGLYSRDNRTGWNVYCLEIPEDKLDEMEQFYIRAYANKGYQLRNKTAGGQGVGKSGIDASKPPKTYRDGLRQGYLNARRYVARLFARQLRYAPRGDKPNKNQEKAMAKFKEFLEVDNDGGD